MQTGHHYAVGESVPAFATGHESNFASGSDVVLVELMVKTTMLISVP